MANIHRIQSTSRFLYVFYTASLLIAPFAVAYYWATFDGSESLLPRVLEGVDLQNSTPIPTGRLALGFLVTMLPCAVMMYGLTQLRRLSRLYTEGRIFTTANCDCLKKLSVALLAWVPARMLFDALISLVLTSGNPENQRLIAVSLAELELTALVLGLVFLVIAWVMGEACELQEDNAGII